jgi:hypothetical protein
VSGPDATAFASVPPSEQYQPCSETRAVLDTVGLSDSQLRDPNTYVTYVTYVIFLELPGECASVCNGPCFGLLLAQRQAGVVEWLR